MYLGRCELMWVVSKIFTSFLCLLLIPLNSGSYTSGREKNYRSDLDRIFVTSPCSSAVQIQVSLVSLTILHLLKVYDELELVE